MFFLEVILVWLGLVSAFFLMILISSNGLKVSRWGKTIEELAKEDWITHLGILVGLLCTSVILQFVIPMIVGRG